MLETEKSGNDLLGTPGFLKQADASTLRFKRQNTAFKPSLFKGRTPDTAL